MEPRLDYYTASPEALKAVLALEAAIFELSVEKPLLELVRLRVSSEHSELSLAAVAVSIRRTMAWICCGSSLRNSTTSSIRLRNSGRIASRSLPMTR